MELLKFGKGNAKLDGQIFTISLASGHACPFAKDCLSKVDRTTNKLSDGKETVFRCFSASQEALFKNVRNQRFYNFDLLVKAKTKSAMKALIIASLPEKATKIRIHVAGDFFNQNYFDAWLDVAKEKTNVIFYAYTKSLPFWIKRLNEIPENFVLNASKGGRRDDLIKEYNLKYAEVVFSEAEAAVKGLEIDHDDSHAYSGTKPFALIIHGTQPAGSEAGKALQKIKKETGIMGYNKDRGYHAKDKVKEAA